MKKKKVKMVLSSNVVHLEGCVTLDKYITSLILSSSFGKWDMGLSMGRLKVITQNAQVCQAQYES